MFKPIKVIDIELSKPLVPIDGLEDYDNAQILVRLHNVPLGYIRVPVTDGGCSAIALSNAVLRQYSLSIARHLLCDKLTTQPGREAFRYLPDVPHKNYNGPFPLVTVAVCTRDRTSDLKRCLASLKKLDYPALDLLVIDNAPTSDATRQLVREHHPNIRYVCERRPGLNWARNRAIKEALGEIVAYTDDDAVVDEYWVKALAAMFSEDPSVMAVTGLVVPYELETPSQILFELYGGFGRGFERKWHRLDSRNKRRWQQFGTGALGTGANMAYRRSLFDRIGYFDPALDVGTLTNGGGDLEMFFRVLEEGYTLVYEPGAIVRHRHRCDYAQLRTQITNNGIGFYSYLVRCARTYPNERFGFIRLGLWWLWWWNARRLLLSFFRRFSIPRDLILAEFWGSLKGLNRYRKSRLIAAEIADSLAASQPERADKEFSL